MLKKYRLFRLVLFTTGVFFSASNIYTATFDYVVPFKDYNNKLILSIQDLSHGNKISFKSNFRPSPNWGYGPCFGGRYPESKQIVSIVNPDGSYTTTISAEQGSSFNFDKTDCSLFQTNTGKAVVLPQVIDPIVYDLSVDGKSLAQYSPCSATGCQDPANHYINAAYYAEWSVWGRHYNPYTIPFKNINQIIFAFIGFDPSSGTIKSLDTSADSWGLSAISHALRQYPYLHASLAFGGWTNNGQSASPMFLKLTSTPSSIKTFSDQAIALMIATGFDGIDIDWEWWSDLPNTQASAQQTLSLIKVIRAGLNQAEVENGKHYFLTLAVNGGRDRILAMQDIEHNPYAVKDYWSQVAKIVDRVNVMNYDYHGGFSVNEPAYFMANYNFYNIPSPVEVGQTSGWSIENSIKTYLQVGLNSKQILMGLPLYARTMKVASDMNGGLFQTVTQAGYGDYEAGVLDYKCLINPIMDPVNGCGSTNPIDDIKNTRFYNSTATGKNLALYQTYGEKAMQPWGYSALTNSFVSYDDVTSAVAKTYAAKKYNLGGMFFWEMDGDSTLPKQSIIEAVKNTLAK